VKIRSLAIGILGLLTLILMLGTLKTALTTKPYTSTRQEQLGTQIDEQVIAYDKADAITKALQGVRTQELQKATQAKLDAAQTAKKLRLELCIKYHLQRVSGGYWVQATNNDCFRFQ